jgi:cell division protein FtsL
MLRLLHLVVIAGLVVAAAYVYKIKFDATVQAERLAKVRREIRQERDAIALLRAEWAKLDNPARIEDLASRHLGLRSVEASQFTDFSKLPPRPPQLVPPDAQDAIAALIENIEDSELPTGSIPPAEADATATPRNGE